MYRVSRTIHIQCVGIQNLWQGNQGNHQIYGHIRCIHTVLAYPRYVYSGHWFPSHATVLAYPRYVYSGHWFPSHASYVSPDSWATDFFDKGIHTDSLLKVLIRTRRVCIKVFLLNPAWNTDLWCVEEAWGKLKYKATIHTLNFGTHAKRIIIALLLLWAPAIVSCSFGCQHDKGPAIRLAHYFIVLKMFH
jgi:hypothetical protein